MKLGRLAKSLAEGVNVKRRAKGLLPRPVGFTALVACLFLNFNVNIDQDFFTTFMSKNQF